jgi:hypothetical protein
MLTLRHRNIDLDICINLIQSSEYPRGYMLDNLKLLMSHKKDKNSDTLRFKKGIYFRTFHLRSTQAGSSST